MAFDCVLIDDDVLMHMSWRMAARRCGKELRTCFSRDEFLAVDAEVGFDRGIAIYVDSNLGGGAKGELVAQELATRGFTNLYLATGYDPASFGAMPWIRGIIGKDPPF